MNKIIRSDHSTYGFHARSTTIVLAVISIVLAIITISVAVHMHAPWLAASAGQTGGAAAKHNSETRGAGPKFGRHAASFFE